MDLDTKIAQALKRITILELQVKTLNEKATLQDRIIDNLMAIFKSLIEEIETWGESKE